MAAPSIYARDRRRFAWANTYKARLGFRWQTVSVTDLISEGPVEGLVNVESSVYLDGDPILDTSIESSFYDSSLSITVDAPVGNGSNVNAPTTVYKGGNTTTSQFAEIGPTKDGKTHRFLFIYDLLKRTDLVIKNIQQSGNVGYGGAYLEIHSPNYAFSDSLRQQNGSVINGHIRVRIFKGLELQEYYIDRVQAIQGGKHIGPAGGVADITITNGGANYSSTPSVAFSAPSSGTTATGTPVLTNGAVTDIIITEHGSGYTSPPTLTFSGGGGTNAAGTCTLSTGSGNFLKLNMLGTTGTGLADLFDPETDLEREVTGSFDIALKCKLSDTKVITVDKNVWGAVIGTNNATAKKFSLSGTIDTKRKAPKHVSSSVQFRTGTLTQPPLRQLAGVGTSSFALEMSATNSGNFVVEGKHYGSKHGTTNYFRNDFGPTPLTETFINATTVGDGNNDSDNDNRINLSSRRIQFSSAGLTEGQISEIDQLRVQWRYPGGLYHTSGSKGDFGASAAHEIHVYFKRDGVWMLSDKEQYVVEHYIDYAKTKSAFSKGATIDLEKFQPFEDIIFHFTRLTPTGPDNAVKGGKWDGRYAYGASSGGKVVLGDNQENERVVADTSALTSVVAIIKEKLNYPHTALAAVTFNSRDYSNLPTRNYEVKGKKVKIPSNYTPRHLTTDGKTATYTKLWDGTFSDENTTNQSGLEKGVYYTDNPAWVFYDMLTNDRYGLGSYLEVVDIDKFSLYKIAKYCDELVPDGKGGTEPRFTANVYLTKATDSYKVLKDLATIFRGMLYWVNGEILTIQDAPTAPVYNFGKANIIDGKIKTETTGSKTRANQIIVSWNNPDSAYKLEPLIVEDRQNILETGRIIKEEANAFGCISEGQAVRYGRWKLWTAVNQTELISFSSGQNAAFLAPGDVINVENSDDFGSMLSGRVSSVQTVTLSGVDHSRVTLDRNIATDSNYSFLSGDTYTFSVLVDTRKVILAQESASITNDAGSPVTTTYTRGDEIEQAWVPTATDSATLSYTDLVATTLTDEDIKKRIIVAQTKQTGGENILLELVNGSNVETLTFNSADIDNTGTKSIITFDDMSNTQDRIFSGTFSDDSVWAIKHVKPTGEVVAESYKEYKILAISENDKKNFDITAAEYSSDKFNSVDFDFELDVPDTVYPTEALVCPSPTSLYLLRVSVPGGGDEIRAQWKRPVNSDGTVYNDLTGYQVKIDPNPLPNSDYIEINNPETLSIELSLENGGYSIAVRAVGDSRYSSWVYAEVDVKDPYGVDPTLPRVAGMVLGAKTDFEEHSITGSLFKLLRSQWALLSNSDYETIALTNPSPSTAATFSQELSFMQHASIETAFILFDRSPITTNNYLLLGAIHTKVYENTSIEMWYDVEAYAPSSGNASENNNWEYTNLSVTVGIDGDDNVVSRTSGSATTFNNAFSVGDVIRIFVGNKYYAAKVAYIEDDDTLYTDRPLNTTDAVLTVTGNSTTKSIAKPYYRPDFVQDAILVEITRDDSNNTYSVTDEWLDVLPGIRGRSVTATPTLHTINYDANTNMITDPDQYNFIDLDAHAVNFLSPVFKVTGDFQSGGGGSADTSFQDPTSGTKYTKRLQGDVTIPYNNGVPLVFTVTVQEENDATKEQTTTVSIGKIRQGLAGASTAVVYLYKNASSAPNTSNIPQVTVTLSGTGGGTITSAVGGISSYQIASTGWYTRPQTPGSGEKQYVTAASANNTGTTDTIEQSEWATPVQFSGADGTAGLSKAIVEAYLITSTVPSLNTDREVTNINKPNVGLTYYFDPADNSGSHYSTTDWYSGSPDLDWGPGIKSIDSTNKYLLKSTAVALATGTSDAIASSEWSDPVVVAQFGDDGPTGVPGKRTISVNMYHTAGVTKGGTAPTVPANSSHTTNFDTGIVTVSGFSMSAPVFDANKDWYYYRFTCTEGGTYTGSAYPDSGRVFNLSPAAGQSAVKTIGFSGLVTFSGSELQNADNGNELFNYSAIDGAAITTGIIKSHNTTTTTSDGSVFTTGTGSETNYTYINLTNGAMASKNFRLQSDGTAEFRGQLKADGFTAGSTMGSAGSLVIGNKGSGPYIELFVGSQESGDGIGSGDRPTMLIHDGTRTRVKLGYLG